MRWADAHPEAMRSMGNAARLEYEQKFTSSINFSQLMNIYRKAMHAVASA
jgi:hypothetical protein